MAAGLLLLLLAVPAGLAAHGSDASVETITEDVGQVKRLTCRLNQTLGSVNVEGHRWKKGDKVLAEDQLTAQQTVFEVPKEEFTGQFTCVFLPEHLGQGVIKAPGIPEVKAVRKSENVGEGDVAVLSCKATAFPPVISWRWTFSNSSGDQPITNQTDKYVVVSSEERSELRVLRADVKRDAGRYTCTAENSEGQASEEVVLRVRHHLAALWPFLGIVAEVLVLVTVIFVYEKRRKADDVLDAAVATVAPNDDLGSAPLKTSAHANDKAQQVRQRNT